MGAHLRWALIQGWLIQINTVYEDIDNNLMINNKYVPLGQHFSPCGRHLPVKLQNVCLSGQKLKMRQPFNKFFDINFSRQFESSIIIEDTVSHLLTLNSHLADTPL